MTSPNNKLLIFLAPLKPCMHVMSVVLMNYQFDIWFHYVSYIMYLRIIFWGLTKFLIIAPTLNKKDFISLKK